jgi:hypothetical protein
MKKAALPYLLAADLPATALDLDFYGLIIILIKDAGNSLQVAIDYSVSASLIPALFKLLKMITVFLKHNYLNRFTHH